MKAISPVIATVIIVAVAIAISIAVALWITGLTSSFTGVEKLEIVNAYAETSGSGWDVKVMVKNTGTKPATIDGIFINNKPGDTTKVDVDTNGDGTVDTQIGTGYTLNQGDKVTLIFHLKGSGDTTDSPVSDKFSSGQTVSIVLHTASGGQYPATITLP